MVKDFLDNLSFYLRKRNSARTFGRALTSYGDTVALRVAYTRPAVGHHCIVGNGMLSRVFAGLNKMLTRSSDD